MFDSEILRNEMLIEQRERYENSFLNMIDIEKSMELDFMINKTMFDYCDREDHYMHLRIDENEYYLQDADFHEDDIPYYEDNIFDYLYEEPVIFESAYYDTTMIGYIKDDDPFDYLDGYDYPEQPSTLKLIIMILKT